MKTNDNEFDPAVYLPASDFEEITKLRVERPYLIEREAQRRKRRARLTRDGKLVLLALDHPARGVTKIRDDELAMGDRYQLLARARCLLSDGDLDGVVASGDMLEELFLLSAIERQRAGRGFLDGRVLVGTMNRGGVTGSSFEMEDSFTALTAERLATLGCDGGKMLYRFDPGDPASGRTALACARALNELHRHHLAAFLEAFAVVRRGDGYETQRDAASLVRQCGIAAALGETSSHLWLKLPYCEDMAHVGRATTLPILLLGGRPTTNPAEGLKELAAALEATKRVRGAIIGRNLLFPSGVHPITACRALTALVHHDASLSDALAMLEQGKAVVRRVAKSISVERS